MVVAERENSQLKQLEECLLLQGRLLLEQEPFSPALNLDCLTYKVYCWNAFPLPARTYTFASPPALTPPSQLHRHQ